MERKARPIELKELELLAFSGGGARFRVRCSKGTYVRTICHDLGQRLGCGGCMSALRRTMAGVYGLDRAFTLEQILAGEAALLPVESLVADRPAVTLTAAQTCRCRNGNPVPHIALPDGEYRVFAPDGAFLMLGRCSGRTLYTVKSFFEVTP